MRNSEYEVLDLIRERWSPKAFSNEKVEMDEIMALLEAATMAPSCYNEQPWRFVVFHEDDQVERVKTFLSDKNKLWNGPVRSYVLFLHTESFAYNGKENKWAGFDTGAAWAMLSLEAQRRGIVTHAMAGFARQALKQHLEIHEDLNPIALVAIGKRGKTEDLDPSLREGEQLRPRKPVDEMVLRVRLEE